MSAPKTVTPKITVQKGIMYIEIPVNHVGKDSKSGKSELLATTSGAMNVEGISVNLNVYKPLQ